MTNTCEHCGEAFTPRHPNRPGRFCSTACYDAFGHAGFKKAVVKGPRMRSAIGHPIAPPSGIVSLSRLALYDKIGHGPHPCHWCQQPVDWKKGLADGALIVDHLDWDPKNDAPDNLVPSCNACNAHRTKRGNRRPIEAGEKFLPNGAARVRALERTCQTCGTEFLARVNLPAGKGLYCSRSCARKGAWASR